MQSLLVVVAALLITLLIVPTCDILFPHFGQKRYDFKSMQPHFPQNEGSRYQTRAITKRSGKLLSLDPGPGIYFCTGTYISVLELILSYSNIYFCTGIYSSVPEWKYISVLEYTCTRINIFVLGYISLYWKTYCCTGIRIVVLDVFFCPGIHIVVLELIFLYCPCGPP